MSAVDAARTGALATPPARNSPLSTTSPAAVRDWSDTPRVPPAVMGPVDVTLSDTSSTSPAALDMAPVRFSWLRAERIRLPVVCTELCTDRVPATSRTIGLREAGTASTTRSSDSVTVMA